MTITYNEIPENLRVPGFFAEFDPSRANSGATLHRLLVLGQRLSTGTVAAGQPVRVSRGDQGDIYFGRGSMLSHMLRYTFAARPNMEVWAIALDDLVAGVAATGTLTVTGTASTSGTLRLVVGGESVRVGVALNDVNTTVAAAIAAAVTAQTDFPVTASASGNAVTLTARHKGTYGNDLTIQVLFEAESQPVTPTFAIAAMSGGTGNPDITDAIAAMGDEWYRWIVCPWTDASNLNVLEAELADRFGPLRQIGGRAFIAWPGTYAAAAAFGDARNSPHISCMAMAKVPQPPYVWAAVNATVAANSFANDPARQLRTLVLPGLTPPEPADRFAFNERNLLLWDGMSTYTVDAGGNVVIESQITMYQENSQGLADDSLLYLNVPELYESYRYEMRLALAPYARYKLAADSSNLPSGQPIMTPKKGRAILLAHYRYLLEGKGWVEDIEGYAETLVVEKTGDRLRIVDQPNFVDNLRQVFMRSELVVN